MSKEVYKIPCTECSASYVSETGRTLECRIKEHKCSVVYQDKSNKLAVHHMLTQHQMNWEAATSLEFASGFNERMFLESWHIKSDSNSINICCDMPGAYYSLIAIERPRAKFEHTCKQSRNVSSDAR